MRQADAAPRSGRSHNWQRVDIVGNPRHREGTDRNVEGGRAEDLGHLCRRLRTSTADMTIKERALARIPTSGAKPGRYQPADDLIAFLEQL